MPGQWNVLLCQLIIMKCISISTYYYEMYYDKDTEMYYHINVLWEMYYYTRGTEIYHYNNVLFWDVFLYQWINMKCIVRKYIIIPRLLKCTIISIYYCNMYYYINTLSWNLLLFRCAIMKCIMSEIMKCIIFKNKVLYNETYLKIQLYSWIISFSHFYINN